MGKIYGGMLILENWKQTRFSQMPILKKQMMMAAQQAMPVCG